MTKPKKTMVSAVLLVISIMGMAATATVFITLKRAEARAATTAPATKPCAIAMRTCRVAGLTT